MLIADEDCDVNLPECVEKNSPVFGGSPGISQHHPLLAVISIAKCVRSLTLLFRQPLIPPDVLQAREKYFEHCEEVLPKNLLPGSLVGLDPVTIFPAILLQNTRLLLCRHNLSPAASSEARLDAVQRCGRVALETTTLMSRCMPAHGTVPQPEWQSRLAISASAYLCTHIWRCTLFLMLRGELAAALVLIRASAVIGKARPVNDQCGRYLSFFAQVIHQKLREKGSLDADQDEELLSFVSADLQSMSDNSWIWSCSDTGVDDVVEKSNLTQQRISASSKSKTFQQENTTFVTAENPWDGWESLQRSIEYLQQSQRQQPWPTERQPSFSPSSGIDGSSRSLSQTSQTSFGSPNQALTSQGPARPDQGKSRMNIADIMSSND